MFRARGARLSSWLAEIRRETPLEQERVLRKRGPSHYNGREPAAVSQALSRRSYVLKTTLSLMLVLAAFPAAAQTWLPAARDARIMAAHPDGNNGGYGYMALKKGNGESRGIVGFELPPGGLADGDVAYLRLFVDPLQRRRGVNGTWVTANLISSCDGAPAWVEGSNRIDRFFCIKKCPKAKDDPSCPVDPSPGVTWKCPIDPEAVDGEPDCAQQWDGGAAFIRRSPDYPDEIFEEAPIDPDAPSVNVVKGDREILFDVTEHVRRAYTCGDLSPSWLIRRASHSGAKMFFFNKEARAGLCACGRVDVCTEPDLEPALYIGPPEGIE
jgi:hypothetical protein